MMFLSFVLVVVAAVAFEAAPVDQWMTDDEDFSDFYGQPDSSVGEKVAAWHPYHRINPEELGSYAKGDILIPRDPPLEGVRNALVAAETHWPGAIVPYVIDGNYTHDELATIYAAMTAIEEFTCVRFVERALEPDYVTIESGASGCWSSIGRIGGNQVLNLQPPACVWNLGTPIHEFMHSLGFFHEQSRHDRDKYVQIFWHNVQAGQEHNFKKFDRVVATTNVPYDFNSVMHYSTLAFSKNNKSTIKPKMSGVRLGQRDYLSKNDIKKVNQMYQCFN
ncbi:hatching enzyme 1.2-like [Cloeon dipterum]|uniref:hatching enzyme 1.2-like n=1 Tax=Cloeon dipterum TaxID=197152 RepID=UPI00321FDA92